MSLSQRLAGACFDIAEKARAVRYDIGFTGWAASKRPGVYTLSDLDLDTAEMHLAGALEEVRATIAAKRAAEQQVVAA